MVLDVWLSQRCRQQRSLHTATLTAHNRKAPETRTQTAQRQEHVRRGGEGAATSIQPLFTGEAASERLGSHEKL